MNKIALSVENLTKVYKDNKKKEVTKALNGLNFEVRQGEVFGLLGPNGAGKTTFLSILGGTVIKTKGKINVWGFNLDDNPRQVKASIGIVPQEVNLDVFFKNKISFLFSLTFCSLNFFKSTCIRERIFCFFDYWILFTFFFI